ncbi:MAG: pyridoxamine 5'-phosphate oxidase family protein [Yokenella regensburgei]|jgi:hypothetical protein|uniref:Pyridoxamine 5'-phosphate oxidase family protein n=1 Tax=Yokenella regensburgei TaxID=158877 RepID=A0ABX9S403_9ENTR|nr:pyridoxamine 5'-phosphate oxidase family protein [Yokenella regensburgei]KAF1370979.1 hypothetical protein FHR25_000106 [Yokenella regensburgei]MDQ4431382.1 pyridoxamine 5'-phosphate oxidase family protein [Yokenella regensburgei]MDR2218238.1 pyridoxamine 5'-phosphate oxidase family protein [Yokenella regensburgei]MDR3105498.1 pyridoxamine 5'-phosphate oxidase family protein [Yokenella regensburgei]RKR65405.1 hypothetical protein C7387_2139 [Yokenella regensburgei]
MSHSEQEVHDKKAIAAIIARHQVCRIALNDSPSPYVVPVNYGYEYLEDRWVLYFHGARTGKKMRLLRKNAALSVEIDGDHQLLRAEQACDYSYAYSSIIASGKAVILPTREEMQHGLDVIMRQAVPGKSFTYDEKMMKAVCVVRVECDMLTCRQRPGRFSA